MLLNGAEVVSCRNLCVDTGNRTHEAMRRAEYMLPFLIFGFTRARNCLSYPYKRSYGLRGYRFWRREGRYPIIAAQILRPLFANNLFRVLQPRIPAPMSHFSDLEKNGLPQNEESRPKIAPLSVF